MTKTYKPSQYELDTYAALVAPVISCNSEAGHKALEEALGVKINRIEQQDKPLNADDIQSRIISPEEHKALMTSIRTQLQRLKQPYINWKKLFKC